MPQADEDKKHLTKEFLEDQIFNLKSVIDQNIGAMNLCKWLLEKKFYKDVAENK